MNLLAKYFLFWWKKNPTRGKICLFVCFSHIIFLILCIAPPPQDKKKITQKIAVRTFQARPPSIQAKTTSTPNPTKAPAKKSPPPQAKPKPKPTPAPISSKKPTPLPQKKTSPPPVKVNKKQQEIKQTLEKIEENIAKIESKNATMNPKSALRVPSAISSYDEDQEDDGFVFALTHYLQENLQLPDIGEVKIALTLHPDGSIDNIKVLSAESEKNRKRLETCLPKLRFPMTLNQKDRQEKSFILTFCNES